MSAFVAPVGAVRLPASSTRGLTQKSNSQFGNMSSVATAGQCNAVPRAAAEVPSQGYPSYVIIGHLALFLLWANGAFMCSKVALAPRPRLCEALSKN